MPRAIVLHRADNVATLIDPGQEGLEDVWARQSGG